MTITSYVLKIDKDLYTKSKIISLNQGMSYRQMLLMLIEEYVEKYDIDITEKEDEEDMSE